MSDKTTVMSALNLKTFNLDAEVCAFIETSLRVSNNLSTRSSIKQQRENYIRSHEYFDHGRPAEIETVDEYVKGRHGDIPVRRYRLKNQCSAADSQIVFIHGGGFILGSLDSHDDICADICALTGIDTLSIDYRLSPEFDHPVHLDDVADAYLANWRPNSVIVGISAGGTLSAGLCHRLKTSAKLPRGQILIYAGLGGDLFNLESYTCNADAPLLSAEDVQFYRNIRCTNNTPPTGDAEFFPLVAPDFAGLPPSVAFSADIDPLRDDSGLYIERLQQAGVDAAWINEPGLVHSYLGARHSSQKAAASFQRICEEIRRLAGIDEN